ncbi:MAG: hypothetical protein WA885_08335 [Phormidesmis sp.]
MTHDQLLYRVKQKQSAALNIRLQLAELILPKYPLRLDGTTAERIAIAASGSWRATANELHIGAAQPANAIALSNQNHQIT